MTALNIVSLVFVPILLLVPSTFAQTPDTHTPAQEQACDKYVGEGARHGLCIAYCEAQDCDNTKFSNPACSTIADRFIAYSVKQGYVKGKKPTAAIDCHITACTEADRALCGGQEFDCTNRDSGICELICTSKFVGGTESQPLCLNAPKCELCVGVER